MLKLGTQTASLMNNLYGNMNGCPTPVVGMGCTILGWTDRRAATILKVIANKNIIGITYDKVTRVDNNGLSEIQEYTFETNYDANLIYYKLDKKGNWRHCYLNTFGRWVFAGNDGNQLLIGVRKHYHDFSF